MAPTVVVLRQFTFSGSGVFTSFEQQLAAQEIAIGNSLPYLYCAFLVKDKGSTRDVLGGCFFLTDRDHNNPSFGTLLRDIALHVEPCASLYKQASTIKPLRLNREAKLPDVEGLDIYAVSQYAALATAGSA